MWDLWRKMWYWGSIFSKFFSFSRTLYHSATNGLRLIAKHLSPKRWLLGTLRSSSDGYIFYICSSVHRNYRLKESNKMQQYTDIYLLLNYSTCFGRPSRPSSGVDKTLVASSGTGHTIWEASILIRDQIRTTFEEACSPYSMICIRGCNYSFMYSWWWAR